MHHVHAEDVAQLILRAILHRAAAVGETFNAVSPQALNLRGYAEAMYRWFGRGRAYTSSPSRRGRPTNPLKTPRLPGITSPEVLPFDREGTPPTGLRAPLLQPVRGAGGRSRADRSGPGRGAVLT